MLFVDTHSHLNSEAYQHDCDEVMERSLAGRVWMINIGTDKESSELAVRLASGRKEGVFAAVALHPENVGQEKFDPGFYRNLARSSKKVVAVGETGLDYAFFAPDIVSGSQKRAPRPSADAAGLPIEDGHKNLQKEIFKKHIELAVELDKPLIIHCRKAHDDILDILVSCSMLHVSGLRGVAHSFLGNYKQARRYRELGFKIAFNGIITYARDYDKVIMDTPISDILIETDCPYLTPVPYRGERNEPTYVLEVAKKLAEIKGISLEDVARQTTENAREVFGI